jgi:hypothetical protein
MVAGDLPVMANLPGVFRSVLASGITALSANFTPKS